MKFSDRSLGKLALEAGQKDRLVFDDDCPGLGVRLTAKGTRTFLVQWTDAATKRRIREPLGVWGSITVEQARTAARAKLGDVAKGIDPRAERIARKAAHDADRAAEALIGLFASKGGVGRCDREGARQNRRGNWPRPGTAHALAPA